MNFFTDFGDQAVILPSVLVIFICLVLSDKKQALAWLGGVGFFLFIVMIGKMSAHACGHYLPFNLQSPSGHTASTALVYGALIGYLIRDKTLYRTFLISVFIAILFGLSRLYLGVHTVADVVVGGIIGTIGATVIRLIQIRLGDSCGIPLRDGVKITLMLGVVFIGLHGIHFNAENKIHGYSRIIWPMSLCQGKL